jgi:hypothetical protein
LCLFVLVVFFIPRFTVRIGNKKILKTFSFDRKPHVDLELRKEWYLERSVLLKRSKVLCIRTTGKTS